MKISTVVRMLDEAGCGTGFRRVSSELISGDVSPALLPEAANGGGRGEWFFSSAPGVSIRVKTQTEPSCPKMERGGEILSVNDVGRNGSAATPARMKPVMAGWMTGRVTLDSVRMDGAAGPWPSGGSGSCGGSQGRRAGCWRWRIAGKRHWRVPAVAAAGRGIPAALAEIPAATDLPLHGGEMTGPRGAEMRRAGR